MSDRTNLYKNLPATPGVYLMRDRKGTLLYVGKAANLKRRISSYFLLARRSPCPRAACLPSACALHADRHNGAGMARGQVGEGGRPIEQLISKVKRVDYEETGTAIEALIREAELIKKYEPPFNIKDKDDKSFLYVQITKEKFPRVLLARGRDIGKEAYKVAKEFGPFTSASMLREALKIIRRIFPYSVHSPKTISSHPERSEGSSAREEKKIPRKARNDKRPCFDYEIGICPGTCAGKVSKTDYYRTIRNIILFLSGGKEKVIRELDKEMKKSAELLNFERAEELRRQIFALKHIQDVAFIAEDKVADSSSLSALSSKLIRIEGYDISNISGVSAVGSMVVFSGGKPDKNEYRKFKIKTIEGANDVGMMTEVLTRRFNNQWLQPDIILVDGGLAQVNAARKVLKDFKLDIPIVGLAKGPERKRNDVIGFMPRRLKNVDLRLLIKVRDEAHRFAISYHKKLRGQNFMN